MIEVTRNENGDYLLTLSPEVAHVMIWGGYEDVVDAVDVKVREALVEIEDKHMTGDEYMTRFGDLPALYARMKEEL